MSNYDGGPNGDYNRPMPRQFQSNTMIPNKSIMVEDEDEMHGVDSRYDRSSDAFGLESALAASRSDRDTSVTSHSLGSMLGKPSPAQVGELQQELDQLKEALRLKDEELLRRENSAAEREERLELERKVGDLELSNKEMQEEIDRMHAEHSSMERSLRSELEEARNAADQRRVDPDISKENERLQQKLKEQQGVIDDVRRQGQLHLEEMRAMADSGGGNFEREEKLSSELQRVEEELKEWKAKYVKAKTQLRSMRASSLGLSISKPDLSRKGRDAGLYADHGAVKDVHITKFQIAIDELIRIARSEPVSVLDHMKTVVIAVRNITTDIDTSSASVKDEELLKKRAKLKNKISATANNVITASKNYATAGGLSPVSLLDAAASHLMTAVVDLVKTVKIRPTPAGELEDDDEPTEPLQNNGYFNVAESLRRRSAVDSVYSALSAPGDTNGADGPGPSVHSRSNSRNKIAAGLSNGIGIQAGFGLREEESDLEELKVSTNSEHPCLWSLIDAQIYIENQSDDLVTSIHVLIEAIRGEEPMSSIRSNIVKILSTVDNVQEAAMRGAEAPTSYQSEWRSQTIPIHDNLEECKGQLLQASNESMSYENHPSAKEFTQKLPPLAFQVARETRELVRRVQGIRSGADDDFS
jgi:hypothetical protein